MSTHIEGGPNFLKEESHVWRCSHLLLSPSSNELNHVLLPGANQRWPLGLFGGPVFGSCQPDLDRSGMKKKTSGFCSSPRPSVPSWWSSCRTWAEELFGLRESGGVPEAGRKGLAVFWGYPFWGGFLWDRLGVLHFEAKPVRTDESHVNAQDVAQWLSSMAPFPPWCLAGPQSLKGYPFSSCRCCQTGGFLPESCSGRGGGAVPAECSPRAIRQRGTPCRERKRVRGFRFAELQSCKVTRSPSALSTFLEEGSPTKKKTTEKGYPYSNLSTGGPR